MRSNNRGGRAPIVSAETGPALGLGGLTGAYTGARIQSRLPHAPIRRLLAILVIAIGARLIGGTSGGI